MKLLRKSTLHSLITRTFSEWSGTANAIWGRYSMAESVIGFRLRINMQN
jgi:hypothetical protein